MSGQRDDYDDRPTAPRASWLLFIAMALVLLFLNACWMLWEARFR
jgi:hypothetical protein